MEVVGNKENVAPATSSDPLHRKSPSSSPKKNSPKKNGGRGRSKSIGPGSLEEPEPPKQSAKDRRKSAFIPATKSILAKNEEAERAARRKSMMNRRVSFAPEATLHTWDIVEYEKNHTTSTDDTESTGHASNLGRSSRSPAPGFDDAQEAEDAELLSSPNPESQRRAKLQNRRSSGIPPMNFNNPEDAYSSGASGSSDVSASEDEESGDETGTGMSLDVEEVTVHSTADSDNSTGSSERLDMALKQAAQTAGTRGIEYDEYGDTSMELVQEEVTNAFKPWAQRQPDDAPGSASLDQENVNPFSPAFKTELQHRPGTIEEEDEEDMSMDVTKVVGGILDRRVAQPASSPLSDGTMDLTQAVGKITSQKRRRSTTESGSPGAVENLSQSKRRRSSVARSSMGDDTMDLTMAVGGIQKTSSPAKNGRRRSLRNRRSSGVVSDQSDATMEFTRAVGGIQTSADGADGADDSFDGNEELSMELTNVLGGIKDTIDSPPATPQAAPSPARSAANTTPKGQERFKHTPDLGAKKLLTPILQEQREQSNDARNSASKTALSPSVNQVLSEPSPRPSSTKSESRSRPAQAQQILYPELPVNDRKSSPIRTPTSSLKRRNNQEQLDSQLQAQELSPTIAKQQRSSPVKDSAATPENVQIAENTRDLTSSMKLLTTPRKEPLRTFTPKKQTPAKQASPTKAITPRNRASAKGDKSTAALPSPVKQLHEDLSKIQDNAQEIESVGLQDFLNKAGIRFMDLTTTKRRLTVMPTPSKTRTGDEEDEDVNLEAGIVAAACTVPELELYQHACHELKRHTKKGKEVINELEHNVSKRQPPLMRAYMHASPGRKLALDTQMRDMKTDARLQSKKMWYAWRSQLLDELMTGLQSIAEGLIQDDETLAQSEEILDQTLPRLAEQRRQLQEEAERLEKSVNSIPEEEKNELEVVRESLTDVNAGLEERRRLLHQLREQVQEQDSAAEHLQETKDEFTSVIQEANRVREACRGVSIGEVTALRESVKHLEQSFGWSITSATSSPSTVTMTYKSELQLFFHPQSFKQSTTDVMERPNTPIRLSYIADSNQKPLKTTLRFFLQLLRASLHGIPQHATKISDLLAFVSNGWATAMQVAESERRLNLETLTETSIISDEELAVVSSILLHKVRTKVRATFVLTATVDDQLKVHCAIHPKVEVIYGEQYNEKNMTEFLKTLVGDSIEGWDGALRQMREKLVARGAKGARK